ncbi:TPA: glycoside hydrolase family protein [Escherichia coli]|nr:glycoside hydrolase family protein [Escherichia coli]
MDLQYRLKEYEGTKQYQAKMKYFRDGKFYPYKDSLGFSTIGYGHLISGDEDYSAGITEAQADALLENDIQKAKYDYQTLGLNVPSDWEDFLIIMIFQLGLGGVKKFKKMLEALRVQNYKEALVQAKDSLWYRQTPYRIMDMIAQLKNK